MTGPRDRDMMTSCFPAIAEKPRQGRDSLLRPSSPSLSLGTRRQAITSRFPSYKDSSVFWGAGSKKKKKKGLATRKILLPGISTKYEYVRILVVPRMISWSPC